MKPSFLTLALVILCQCHATFAATNAFDPAQLAYNLKTTVEAYEKVGRKDPKWDADAKKCLIAFARIRSCTNDIPPEYFQDVKTNIVHLAAVGCDDPLIRYLYLRHGVEKRGTEAALAFSEAASALQKSEYPDIRKFYATVWEYKSLTPAEAQLPKAGAILTTATSYLARALDDASIPQREADQACDFLMSTPWWAESTRWSCYQTLEPVLTNRWKGSSMALLAKGRAYLSYGWHARGTGYADTVSDSGWKLMSERLKVAAETLEAAWNLDPHDVRICREMMRVELGQGQGRERLEMWFERGMKLDPANYDLCMEKIEYLRPRWYGSIRQMIDFGRECTTNTNWSGSVRFMLADAHNEASRDTRDNAARAAYWKQTTVWPDVQFTFNQFFKLNPDAVGYRHNYARYAAWCGQWQEFLNQVKMFPSTNFTFFGGEARFNEMVKTAKGNVKKE